MTVRMKLLLVFAAAALVHVPTSDASAIKPRARSNPPAQAPSEPPAAAPRQFFATRSVEPLTPELEQSLKPRDSFKECDVCPEMVVIPKGSFMKQSSCAPAGAQNKR